MDEEQSPERPWVAYWPFLAAVVEAWHSVALQVPEQESDQHVEGHAYIHWSLQG
jgi:hypothetical protein